MYRHIVAALTLASVALADAFDLPPPRIAPSHPVALDYYSTAGKFYKLHTNAATWVRAREICRQEGAELPYPSTKQDRVVLNTIKGSGELWLGVSASWRTLDDKPLAETTGLTGIGAYLTTDNRVRASADPTVEFPFACQMTAAILCNTSAPGYALGPDGRSCYKLHESKRTWSESLSACEAEGAHLAIANSNEEADHLVSIMAEAPTNFKFGIHSGFHDALMDGVFTTIDGDSLASAGYALWEDGQPDNSSRMEYCGNLLRNGKLNDLGCTWRLPYICEREVSTLSYVPSEVSYDVVRAD